MPNVPAIRDQFAAAKRQSLAQLGSNILAIAEAANAAIMALPPKPHGYVRAIFPNNTIVYEYQRSDLAVEFALDVLRALSPRKSGAYQEAHTVFVNGAAVQPPYQFNPTDDVVISNLEPYARKIEIGRMKMSVPGTDHVYQQAQQIIQREFAGLIDVKFTWRSLSAAGSRPRVVTKKKGRTSEHALQSQPALVFKAIGNQALPPSTALLVGADLKLLS